MKLLLTGLTQIYLNATIMGVISLVYPDITNETEVYFCNFHWVKYLNFT